VVKNSIEKLKFEKNSENENIATNIYIYIAFWRILAEKKPLMVLKKIEIKIIKHVHNHWFFEIIRIIGF